MLTFSCRRFTCFDAQRSGHLINCKTAMLLLLLLLLVLAGGVANAANKLDGRASWATSKEVQGRSSRQQAVSSPNEGRKLKKLKKKIQKLLLPLLIAYKLKFLTLIPVLIGGLTLLVGTTGLAGFFFALFTAVMSLKTSTGAGHGSKAIVLKKI